MQLKQFCSRCEQIHDKKLQAIREKLGNGTPEFFLASSALGELKPVTLVSESHLQTCTIAKYSCGHVVSLSKIEAQEKHGYDSLTKGHKSFDYQTVGIKFIQDSNFNCLIADEMGLGKTVQALLAFRESIADLSPCILAVKSSTFYQWVAEFKEWTTLDGLGILPIIDGKSFVVPGFNTYLISHSMLRKFEDKLIALKPKLFIGDEVQAFKNPGASCSKALVKICQDARIPHKIFLSGTPIKNRASEYFTVLNLLRPDYFPSFKRFCMQWLEPNEKGQYTRIRTRAIESFRQLTSKFILRRECKDVQADLPPLRRYTTTIVIEDEALKQNYNSELDLFENFMNDSSAQKSNIAMLGWMARLRHAAGLAKLPECVEMAKSWLDSNEGKKLTIGIHHKDVRDSLFFELEPYGCLKFSGEDDPATKALKVKTFIEDSNTRVMVINELSGGTGVDGLQHACYNVFCLERQWTWADERQFEKRFERTGQTMPVQFNYLMAYGTIDTFLNDLVEEKQRISQETFGCDYDLTSDSGSLKELAERTIAAGHLK